MLVDAITPATWMTRLFIRFFIFFLVITFISTRLHSRRGNVPSFRCFDQNCLESFADFECQLSRLEVDGAHQVEELLRRHIGEAHRERVASLDERATPAGLRRELFQEGEGIAVGQYASQPLFCSTNRRPYLSI